MKNKENVSNSVICCSLVMYMIILSISTYLIQENISCKYNDYKENGIVIRREIEEYDKEANKEIDIIKIEINKKRI